MIGDTRSGGSEPIVYLDFSDIHDDGLEHLKKAIQRLIDAIEPHEPQLVTYGFHLNEPERVMTVTAVHPDSASLELHMDIGRDEFRKVGKFITLKRIHVYGHISERARQMLQHKAEMLGGATLIVSERFAGFDHLPATQDRGQQS